MKNIFVELLHCTLKVNPWADSTLCKNQEPTDWLVHTKGNGYGSHMPAVRDQEVTNGGTSQDWFQTPRSEVFQRKGTASWVFIWSIYQGYWIVLGVLDNSMIMLHEKCSLVKGEG